MNQKVSESGGIAKNIKVTKQRLTGENSAIKTEIVEQIAQQLSRPPATVINKLNSRSTTSTRVSSATRPETDAGLANPIQEPQIAQRSRNGKNNLQKREAPTTSQATDA